MKIKKHLIALAILGGIICTACSPESIDTDDQHEAGIHKKTKLPTNG